LSRALAFSEEIQTLLATPLRATARIYKNESLNEPQYALTKVVSKEVHWEVEGCLKRAYMDDLT